MKTSMKSLLRSLAMLFVLGATILNHSVYAGNKQLNVQGKLTNSGGTALTGPVTITFNLWSGLTGGTTLFTETLSTVTLSTGVFNVTLGKSTTSLDNISFDTPYWLGVKVSTDNEMSPRQPLGASAYALGSLGNFNVNGRLGVGYASPANKVVVVTTAAFDGVQIYGTESTGMGASLGLYAFPGGTKTFVAYADGRSGQDGLKLLSGFSDAFRFMKADQTDLMVIKSTGAIGIGISNPSFDFHLVKNKSDYTRVQINNTNTTSGQERRALVDISGDNGSNDIAIMAGKDSLNNSFQMIGGNSMLQLGIGGFERCRIQNGVVDGEAVIDIAAPFNSTLVNKVFIAGYDSNGFRRFYVDGTGQYFQSSSQDLKTNITPLTNSLGILTKLSPVSYNFISDKPGDVNLGFIAQDLALVVPEAVSKDQTMINYQALIPMLVESIKELQAEVDQLKQQVGVK